MQETGILSLFLMLKWFSFHLFPDMLSAEAFHFTPTFQTLRFSFFGPSYSKSFYRIRNLFFLSKGIEGSIWKWSIYRRFKFLMDLRFRKDFRYGKNFIYGGSEILENKT